MLRFELATRAKKKLDIEGTYPNLQICLNISKETTIMEMVAINGFNDRVVRQVGINLSGGAVNATEICSQIYKLPTPTQWVELMRNDAEFMATY